MTSSAFAGLSDADRYVVGRLAARERGPAEELAELPQDEIDQHIPGARLVYKRREQIAAELLRRRGIDPTSAEYRAAARHASSSARRIQALGWAVVLVWVRVMCWPSGVMVIRHRCGPGRPAWSHQW